MREQSEANERENTNGERDVNKKESNKQKLKS